MLKRSTAIRDQLLLLDLIVELYTRSCATCGIASCFVHEPSVLCMNTKLYFTDTSLVCANPLGSVVVRQIEELPDLATAFIIFSTYICGMSHVTSQGIFTL